jgi:hypothetical protein
VTCVTCSIVASLPCVGPRRKHRFSQLLHCCMASPLPRRRYLSGRCVAKDFCLVSWARAYCAVTKQRASPSVLHATLQKAAKSFKNITGATESTSISETSLKTMIKSTEYPKSLELMGILFIIYIICSICSSRHSTHSISRFTMFVQILLNILGSTIAQQYVILCLMWRSSQILTAYTISDDH